MKSRALVLSFAALMLIGVKAVAGGFLIYEHNASGTGMCGAVSAMAGDPSSVYFSPAAITELDGVQLQLGFTGILPYVSYTADNQQPARTYPGMTNGVYDGAKPVLEDGTHDAKAKVHGFNPIHLYATWKIFDSGLTVGFGLNNPFGLGTFWPGDWDGRFIATETMIQTFFGNPVVAVDLAKMLGFKDSFKLSVAAGYTFVYATAHLAQDIDLRVAEPILNVQNPYGEMRMDGSAMGHGWNTAVYAEWPGQIGFGFSIRGGFDSKGAIGLPFSGTAKFSFNEAGIAAISSLGLQFPENPTQPWTPGKTGGDVTIKLPMHFNTGISYLGVKNLRIGLDFYAADFRSYDTLALTFKCVKEGTCSTLEKVQPVVKNWGWSFQVSLGAEYMITDWLPVRIGYGIVTSPVPADTYDPSLPDGRRDLITVGTGYHGSWWKIDIGYMLAMWKGAKNNTVGDWDGDHLNPNGYANGKFQTYSHLLGLTFTAKI